MGGLDVRFAPVPYRLVGLNWALVYVAPPNGGGYCVKVAAPYES